MSPNTSSPLSQAALRCLQRVSKAAPDAVPPEAVIELHTAAQDLLAYTLKTCVQDQVDHTVMLPAGASGKLCAGQILGLDQQHIDSVDGVEAPCCGGWLVYRFSMLSMQFELQQEF
jgi:hypothetical protein